MVCFKKHYYIEHITCLKITIFLILKRKIFKKLVNKTFLMELIDKTINNFLATNRNNKSKENKNSTIRIYYKNQFTSCYKIFKK